MKILDNYHADFIDVGLSAGRFKRAYDINNGVKESTSTLASHISVHVVHDIVVIGHTRVHN